MGVLAGGGAPCTPRSASIGPCAAPWCRPKEVNQILIEWLEAESAQLQPAARPTPGHLPRPGGGPEAHLVLPTALYRQLPLQGWDPCRLPCWSSCSCSAGWARCAGSGPMASYKLAIEGKTYIVHLTQKNFLPQNFEVYGHDAAGIMKPLKQQFQNFCYYQGYIEGHPNSMVTITTCNGLRGLLQFENVSYGIEPLEASVGFEHVIYQVKNEKKGISLYTELKDASSRIKSVEPPHSFSQYIEMHIVVENNLYNRLGSDTTVVTQQIFQLVGLINAIFTSFNLTVTLSSLEFWTDENKIPITGDVIELLYRFQKWKISYLVLRPHDVAFLLVYKEVSSYLGATFRGMMCDKDHGGGVVLHPRTISLESLATVLAQLLSLSMGIGYDDVSRCHCPGPVCVMSPQAIHSSGMKIFSNCSMESFAHFLSAQKSQCLSNQPSMEPAYKYSPVCGNSVVEAGEACDCGTQQHEESLPLYAMLYAVIKLWSPCTQEMEGSQHAWFALQECQAAGPECCDFITCKLKTDAECDSGPCCNNCKFKEKGNECRASQGECDLVEYCNGTSASCPEDVFVINGHPCGNEEWLCINGTCQSGADQCRIVFGTVFQIHTAENMWVRDGTVCASKKVCKNRQCVADAFLGYDCTPANRYYVEAVDAATPSKRVLFLIIPFLAVFCALVAVVIKVYFQRKKWRAEEDYTSDDPGFSPATRPALHPSSCCPESRPGPAADCCSHALFVLMGAISGVRPTYLSTHPSVDTAVHFPPVAPLRFTLDLHL
ncbi:disintegrin and metalloproteinase domain-containing protein 2-like [Ctenodactylus gundi]